MNARARFTPATVTTPLCIEAGDLQLDAYGTYGATHGDLLSVRVNGRELSISDINAALHVLRCDTLAGDWSDDLDPDELTELINEAAQDAEADWGDYMRDLRMDQ